MMTFETNTNEPASANALEKLLPTEALLVHPAMGSHFVTHHGIEAVKGRLTIGAGRALRNEDARRLLESLLGITSSTMDFLPVEQLVRDPMCEAWFVPAARRPMHFRVGSLYKGILEVEWPTLLFVATRTCLRVAALASNKRPSAETPVFHAPLMNIFSDGRVCRAGEDGAAQPVAKGKAWCENAVFNTAFSHQNHDRVLAAYKATDDAKVLRFWKARHRKAVAVKRADLVPMRRTVHEFIVGSAQ